MNTITLPDGYNGHVVVCSTDPIEVKDGIAKLPVIGSTYLFALCPIEKIRPTNQSSRPQITAIALDKSSEG